MYYDITNEADKDLREREARLTQARGVPRKRRWWVTAIHNGRRIVLGPCMSEEEANNVGFSKLPASFEVVELPTADEAKATRMLKGRVLKQTGNIDTALERMQHKV